MKKDIQIPKVEHVLIAVIQEHNDVYNSTDWNAYIINNKDVDLDLVIIVSHGYSKTKTTATFRKKIDRLPKKSYAKIELLQEDLFTLNNQYKVSFFEGNQLYDKTYTFEEQTINENSLRNVPLMNIKGVVAD